MTQSDKSNGSLKEYLIVALLVVVGTPIAVWWGLKDGKELAAAAYPDGAAGASAAADEDDDYDDYEDEAAAEDGEVPAPTPEAIERGAALFQTHCVACHGANADGKGPAAVAFTPAPRDFTDPAAKWTIGREPAQIHQAVSQGVPGTAMAGFAAALSPDELWDVVHYLGSLPGVSAARE
jgi:mono/diheme cytochrome c family protein